ncbi:hypothetical protein PR202_ga16766 [Eleusine coracana subsp. coracana]|uniref:peptide-methionine (R)-S-oxide reductase n=1 Tax=Eleusine coracana subsp. coracana TaxID=191504 RepID=A0AAV5CN46_ELECO|nr:hypothetical protein PR202_ga16766 [Eleusine coracana subsp. coracana]
MGAGIAQYKSLSEEEWKKRLTEEQYYVTRQKGTERAFTGEYWNTRPQAFITVYAVTHLCLSHQQSSTVVLDGHPTTSLLAKMSRASLICRLYSCPRTEVLCAVCDAHLGHVFDDGPPPTGQRYCINRYVRIPVPVHSHLATALTGCFI